MTMKNCYIEELSELSSDQCYYRKILWTGNSLHRSKFIVECRYSSFLDGFGCDRKSVTPATEWTASTTDFATHGKFWLGLGPFGLMPSIHKSKWSVIVSGQH
ncbi:hypothetical protein M8J77_023911 [Diaphorina citri]|nr:hypothetical protein M8J77_023911 [Diaphorina citri]